MPIVIKCADCSYILAQYYQLPSLPPNPETSWIESLRSRHRGSCPRCGRKLASKPTKIEIKPLGV